MEKLFILDRISGVMVPRLFWMKKTADEETRFPVVLFYGNQLNNMTQKF